MGSLRIILRESNLMKTSLLSCFRGRQLAALGLAAAAFWLSPVARAGLTIDVHLYHDSWGYYFYPWLSADQTPPAFPDGNYLIASPQYPTNGSSLQFQAAGGALNYVGGGGNYYSDFNGFLYGITNGQWSIWVTNAASTNQYQFQVTVSVLTSNGFGPAPAAVFPTDGAQFVTNQPLFQWTGPANWAGTLSVIDWFFDAQGNQNLETSADLPPDQTSWLCPVGLPDGTNDLSVDYSSNITSLAVASLPLDNSAHPISGWTSTATMESRFVMDPKFVVGRNTNAAGALVAHYTFDSVGNPGQDSSGHGYDLDYNGGYGVYTTPDAMAGASAANFDGASFLSYTLMPPGVLRALAADFTLSFWIKTSQDSGNESGPAWAGAGIVSADIPGQFYDSIPAALDGGQIGFNTGPDDDTLNSTQDINDGNYHHVAITRAQGTGEKRIYIDGVLDSSDLATTSLLNDPVLVAIGCKIDASQLAPGSASPDQYFQGLLDDIQIYSAVLSPSDVTFIYNHPGEVVTGSDFNSALNTTNLSWTTGGDADWVIETTNTYDGVSAAASGGITNSQQSWLQTTVSGPGTLSFWWKVSSEDGYDFLEFDLDGTQQDSISGEVDWEQHTYEIPPGTHTLQWLYSKDPSFSSGLDAGFLDLVSYSISTVPQILLNPFDQTNYPGYSVALEAAATNSTPFTWQWFKVGDPTPIPSATNALFIPTTSGTPTVAGRYYAVASSASGSINTTTAQVSFLSAPVPPDWSRAFRSAFNNNNTDDTTNYNIACLQDSAGNLYTVGSIIGTNFFGADTLISAKGVTESTFLKQTATGQPLWGRAMTNNGNGGSFPRSMAGAPGDGFYVSGVFFGTNWLGTNLLVDTAGDSTYLARFDANGNALWVRTIVGTNINFTAYHALASDPAGNVTLSMLIGDTTSFGSTNVSVTGQRGVLAQYDLNGNLRWLQVLSGWCNYLTCSAGRLYGSMTGNPTNYIGGMTNVSDRRQTLFCLDAPTGQGLWVRGLAARQDQGNPLGLIDDFPLLTVSGTNVFVVGSAWGSNAAFGSYTVNFPAAKGQYFARYDTNGVVQLATSFGSETTFPWAAVADPSGNVYIGGDFDSYSWFGQNLIAAPFYQTIQNGIPGQGFVAKFDRNGNPLWARAAQSSSSYLNTRDIAWAGDGVWACGFFDQIATFGTNTLYGPITVVGFPFGTLIYHPSGFLAKVTDSAPLGLPVTLLHPQTVGANFQFQFLSQSGFTHAILYRTNLASGSWRTNTSIAGDGSLKTVSIPLSVFGPSPAGFVRVTTQ